MTDQFPSPLERTVASVLLLLSTTIPHSSKLESNGVSAKEKQRSENKSNSSNGEASKSHSSSTLTTTTTSDGSSSHKLRIVAVVARCHEMKFKVVRKTRSKACWRSDHRKVVLALPATASSRSESTEVSCISSTSSAASSARSRRHYQMQARHFRPKKSKVGSGSASIRRQAEAILKLLSGGCYSEFRIRQVLGDSPDTSKALRMLLKQEEIKRSGTGGRLDPFIYKIASEN